MLLKLKMRKFDIGDLWGLSEDRALQGWCGLERGVGWRGRINSCCGQQKRATMAFFRFNSSSHGHHHLVYGSSSCGATLQQCATTIGFGIRRPTTTTTTCALRFSARTKMDVGLGRRRRGIIFGAARSPTPGDLSRVQSQTLNEIAQEDEEKVSGKGLVSSHGWRVRDASRFDTEELRAVAHIQASSFHLQTAVFDQLFFKLFKVGDSDISSLLHSSSNPLRHKPCLEILSSASFLYGIHQFERRQVVLPKAYEQYA